MNYEKYIPEGQSIQAIVHQHWLTVMDSFILWLSFGAILPAFLYYQSERIRDIIPFYILEMFLFCIFLKIVYELFNWYNDVWLITQEAVYDIEWSLLKTKTESIHHENIEGVEIDKHRIWDNIFNKGDIIIHKFGEEEIVMYNAYAPYKAADIMEQHIHPDMQDDNADRFDLIMDALSGVVSEHLKTHGIPEKHESQNNLQAQDFDDEYAIDLRHEK